MKLLRKTTLYLPTLSVLGMLLLLTAVAGTVCFRGAGRFLSPTQPVGSGTLLIEGWIDRAGFAAAVEAYRRGSYERLVTTGGPYFLDCDRNDRSYAAQVAKLAHDSGLADGELGVIAVPASRTDRTHTAAMATARWLQSRAAITSVDVYSQGPHARRSWLVYRRALEPLGVEVGVMAAAPAWDVDTWWRHSEGVKAVVSEGAGWLWETCCSAAAEHDAVQTMPRQ